MTSRPDDTVLDALSAQARAYPELPEHEVEDLLVAGRSAREPQRSLVEHHLSLVLDSAIAHRDRGVELFDLFQEGSVAATVAVEEYVGRGGSAAGLRAYLARVVDAHLESVIEQQEAAKAEERRMVEDAQLLETAEITLRKRLGREATPTEIAAMLEWSKERVDLVGQMLVSAREIFDEDILQYLDDE